MSEEEARDDIIDIINNEEPVACDSEAPQEEPVKEEPVKEETISEEEIKPKAKAKSKSRAKPKVKTVKEPVVEEKPVEPIVEQPVEEQPAPVKVDKLKQTVKCPDCLTDMTVHTLKYIQKRKGFCKAVVKDEPEKTPEPVPVSVPKTKDYTRYCK